MSALTSMLSQTGKTISQTPFWNTGRQMQGHFAIFSVYIPTLLEKTPFDTCGM
jgi:hypothetical protein